MIDLRITLNKSFYESPFVFEYKSEKTKHTENNRFEFPEELYYMILMKDILNMYDDFIIKNENLDSENKSDLFHSLEVIKKLSFFQADIEAEKEADEFFATIPLKTEIIEI